MATKMPLLFIKKLWPKITRPLPVKVVRETLFFKTLPGAKPEGSPIFFNETDKFKKMVGVF